MHKDLEAWWQTRTGGYLQKQERAVLGEALPTLFGFYLVQSGCWGDGATLLDASAIRTRIVVGDCGQAGSGVAGDAAYLPFAADSVDVVLLPHTLERVEEPEQALREAERVLHGEGHVVMLGFHAFGPWGLLRYSGLRRPWHGRFLSLWRLRIWLRVLGFEEVEVRHYLFRPPFASRGMLRRFAFLDRLGWRLSAGAYMVVARKRVFAMTPLRLKRSLTQRAFTSVAKPTTRSLG
jgi:SAM-dependent methyltransferase